jgi:hypothetical protein
VVAGTIRDAAEYAGVRVKVRADGSCGVPVPRRRRHRDQIQPPPVPVDLPRRLGGDPGRLLGNPMAMVIAEKIVTMVERAEANTRWRNFADDYLLSHDETDSAAEVRQAVGAVAAFRGVRPRSP